MTTTNQLMDLLRMAAEHEGDGAQPVSVTARATEYANFIVDRIVIESATFGDHSEDDETEEDGVLMTLDNGETVLAESISLDVPTYTDGFADGFTDGFTDGHEAGFTAGIAAGFHDGHYEGVCDALGLPRASVFLVQAGDNQAR